MFGYFVTQPNVEDFAVSFHIGRTREEEKNKLTHTLQEPLYFLD